MTAAPSTGAGRCAARSSHRALHCDSPDSTAELEVSTDDIRQEFIQAHVMGHPINLKELAERYGRSHAGLRQAASKGGWSKQAAMAVAERDAHAAAKIQERTALTYAVMEEAVEREVDVRRRHAHLARVLQQVALERLVAITPKELTASTALVNSSMTASPMVLTTWPVWATAQALMICSTCLRCSRPLDSSSWTCLVKPAMSAKRIAASLRRTDINWPPSTACADRP